MCKTILLLGLAVIFAAGISGCSSSVDTTGPTTAIWSLAELRVYDPPDHQDPSGDLIAGYARLLNDQAQVRLDLLDSETIPDHDLYIAVDSHPGGEQSLPNGIRADIDWEWLIYLPAEGAINVLSSQNQDTASPSVLAIRNSELDTLELSIYTTPLQGSPNRLHFQAFSTTEHSGSLIDSTAPFAISGSPPSPSRILLAFWNTLPAYSPAQALRRWDGAHTGPLGARHGLGNLLKAARDYQAPIALLDLKTITSLAALDFIDQVDTVQSMAASGLLVLPDNQPVLISGPPGTLPGPIVESAAATSRQISAELGLPASQFVYGDHSRSTGNRYRFLFLPYNAPGISGGLPAGSQIFRYTDMAVLPISTAATTTQATLQGPSLEIRRELVNAALETSAPGPAALTVLGGDLSLSTWGGPQHASSTLRWLKAHPWIDLQDANDLLATRPAHKLPEQFVTDGSQVLPVEIENGFVWAAQNPNNLAANAWYAFLSSYAPVSPAASRLAALRQAYLGQANILLETVRWAQHPHPIASCDNDPDKDGQPECILANDSQFTLYEIDRGALEYAFVLRGGEAHQWIAPSSQMITGLSDPALWQLDQGLAADPAVIPGAFSDAGPFQSQIEPGMVTFTSPDLTKTFTLSDNGMGIRYQAINAQSARIPLAIDPWLRFTPDWEERYDGQDNPPGIIWGVPGVFGVELNSNANLAVQAFTASRAAAKGPENPNIDYPAGHFVMFPLAVVDVTAPAGFDLQVKFLP